MSDNNAIGTGSLILTANADKMLANIDRASKQAQAKASEMSKAVNTRMAAFGGGLGGGLIGGGLAEIGKGVGASLVAMANSSKEFQAAIERSVTLGNELAKSMDRVRARADEALGAIVDPAEKLKALEEQIKLSERELSGAKSGAAGLNAEIAKLNSNLESESWQLWLGGGFSDSIKRAENDLAAFNDTAAKVSYRLAKLRNDRLKLLDPSSDPAKIGAINAAIARLDEQIATVNLSEPDRGFRDFLANSPSADQILKYTDRMDRLNKAMEEFKANSVFTPRLAMPQLNSMMAFLDKALELANSVKVPDLSLSGAAGKGSREAYIIEAQYETGNMLAIDSAKKQLRETELMRMLLQKLVDKNPTQFNVV